MSIKRIPKPARQIWYTAFQSAAGRQKLGYTFLLSCSACAAWIIGSDSLVKLMVSAAVVLFGASLFEFITSVDLGVFPQNRCEIYNAFTGHSFPDTSYTPDVRIDGIRSIVDPKVVAYVWPSKTRFLARRTIRDFNCYYITISGSRFIQCLHCILTARRHVQECHIVFPNDSSTNIRFLAARLSPANPLDERGYNGFLLDREDGRIPFRILSNCINGFNGTCIQSAIGTTTRVTEAVIMDLVGTSIEVGLRILLEECWPQIRDTLFGRPKGEEKEPSRIRIGDREFAGIPSKEAFGSLVVDEQVEFLELKSLIDICRKAKLNVIDEYHKFRTNEHNSRGEFDYNEAVRRLNIDCLRLKEFLERVMGGEIRVEV